MMDLQALTDNFGIPGVLRFTQTESGLVRADITTPACTAQIYLHGAHLALWQPTDHEAVLFLSDRSAFAPGKAIRGGVPVIFPWFGAPADSPIGSQLAAPADAPMHGFARTSEWTLAFAAMAGDELHMTLTLSPNEASRAVGFDHFQLAYNVVLGAELKLQLTVANQGSAPLHFEEALHTYLSVGDARQVAVIGLSDTEYLDKTDGFKRKRQVESPFMLTGETDRPYLNTVMPVDVDDPVLKRSVSVVKSNSKTTVVWNPWEERCAKLADMSPNGWEAMVCVETANVGENALELAPQKTHTMEARIIVQRYAE
jgi:glucose-6-phosphate 1-epimerase